MKSISHENCIRLKDFYESKEEFILVLELVTGGELFDRIVEKEFYSEDMAAKTIKQLGNCLAYLHSNGIVHRDLKPENLLYVDDSDDAAVKITDFGLAKRIKPGTSSLTTQCGTPNYVAPEILAKKNPYGCPSDMWSAGCILYILLGGIPPFWKESTSELFSSIMKGEYDFPNEFFDQVSEEAKDVIRKLLTIDPDRRMTAEQLINDPWVNGGASTEAIGGDTQKRLMLVNAKVHLCQAIHCLVTLDRIKDIIATGSETPYDVSSLEHHAHGLCADGAKQELNDSFKILDQNGDGELCAKVLSRTINTLGGNITEEQVSKFFINRVDGDNDGFISFEEFEYIINKNPTQATHADQLQRIFDEMDTDTDKAISPAELEYVLEKLNRKEPQDVITAMIQSVDDNNDGEIDFDEFLVMMGGHK
jgi:serine/threonine protein kinase